MTSIAETAITRLLASDVEDYEDVPLFRTVVLDNEEAAGLLVRALGNGAASVQERAAAMLSLFGPAAYPAIAAGLAEGTAEWRSDLVAIAWTITSTSESPQRAPQFATLRAALQPLLEDKRPIASPITDTPVEIEYSYRVCDEAFLLLRYAEQPAQYDEDEFRGMTFEERDEVIRAWRGRANLT
ncbi:MAG: hypothetical protein JWO97_3854 [Acidobacteria bacterium]|nr:hypothetical protein [Acidobacteriota bacterium]